MADSPVLHARARDRIGKQESKRIRHQGFLPAVIYGEDKPSVTCSVDRKVLDGILHAQGRNAIFSLVVGDDGDASPQTAIIKEIQHHPVEGDILHVDFHRISLTEQIVVEVALEVVGVPAGVRTSGGILEHMLHRVEVECLPTQIPDRIPVDVTHMEIGDTLQVSDLVVEGDARVVTEGDRQVLVVVPPTVIQVEAEEEEEEVLEEEGAAEPEVIERGKREEEEGEEQ